MTVHAEWFLRAAAIASRAGAHTRSRFRSPGNRSAPGANLPWPRFPGCARLAYPGYERLEAKRTRTRVAGNRIFPSRQA